MTYPELIENELLHLPAEQSKDKNFSAAVGKLLHAYLDLVESLPNDDLQIQGLSITGQYVKNVQREFVPALLRILDYYLDGKPARAYHALEDAMGNGPKNFGNILKFTEYRPGESFFRMRIERSNFPLSCSEMFHLPFEKRGLVSTQRFSIPGFPCLYLGRTIYGCWEELNRPDLNEFYVSRLETTHPIRVLDLTRPAFTKYEIQSTQVYYYFMLWPLIACCSFVVRDYKHPFRPEYIIPQLLLQWIRDTENIDGIRFNSTHINVHKTKSKGDFSNLVLPVKSSGQEGHCLQLQSLFEMTNPVSWQVFQHAGGGQNFDTERQHLVRAIRRIEQLELISGMPNLYDNTALGKLEIQLNSMQTFPLS